MKKDLNHILSNSDNKVAPETLLLYLQGKLSPEQQHEVEKQLLNDDFETDALEGLKQIKDGAQVTHVIEQLNHDLRKKTGPKKRKRKSEFKEDPWLWISLFIILLLVVISYIIIHKQLQGGG